MTRTPEVSIGLPVYNGECYLSETIESVLAQTFGDFELVISDNASTDRTWEICEEHARKDSRIKPHRNSVNAGALRNLARVTELATAKYFMWLSHDDLLKERYVESCYDALESSPDYQVCCTRFTMIDGHGRELYSPLTDFNLDSNSQAERFLKCLENLVACPTAIYGLLRRELCRTIRFDRLLGFGPDWVILLSWSLLGKMKEIGEPLFLYRRHEAQISHKGAPLSQVWQGGLLEADRRIPLLPRMVSLAQVYGQIFHANELSLSQRARLAAACLGRTSVLRPVVADVGHLVDALTVNRPHLNRHLRAAGRFLVRSGRSDTGRV